MGLKNLLRNRLFSYSVLTLILTSLFVFIILHFDNVTAFVIEQRLTILTTAVIILVFALIVQNKQANILRENEKLYQKLRKKQKHIDKDMQMAQTVQKGILGQPLETCRGIQIAAECRPATEIGGDFLGTQKKNNLLNFFVGDVSGHGISSALVMSLSDVLLHETCAQENSIEKIAETINKKLYKYLNNNINFVTLFLGQLNPKTKECCYITAGQHAALLFKKGQKTPVKLSSKGTILGMYPDSSFKQGRAKLSSGDKIYIFTDGFTETPLKDQLLGEQGLIKIIKKQLHLPVKESIANIYQELRKIAKNPKDDLSLMIIACD